MKTFITLILTILCSTNITLADTYIGTTGDCTYTLDTSAGTLVISGTGAMADYSSSSSIPWHSYRSYVKTVTIEDGVTSIGDYAFYGCTSLTSVTIGSSVTSIGSAAFCVCTSLSSITIGSGVTSIGSYAFNSSTSLTSITVSEGNTAYVSVDGVLYTYDMTTLVRYPGGKTDTSFTIPESVTSIGESAFYYCTKLTSVTIPDGVTSIGDYAFVDCSSLTSVTFGDISALTSIGECAFYECTSLTSVTIGSSVTSIGSFAFCFCTSLTSITSMNTTPPTIDGSTFSDYSATLYAASTDYATANYWKDFYTIKYTDDVLNSTTTVTGQCGDNMTYTLSLTDGTLIIDGTGDMYNYTSSSLAPWYVYRSYITNITISDEATGIGSYAFYKCLSLTSVTIPDGVTSIGDYAFYKCTSLTSITIPDGVISIGNHAFSYCSNLTSITVSVGNTAYVSVNGVLYTYDMTELIYYPAGKTDTSFTIPKSVTSIGNYAFESCISLTNVTFGDNSALTSIGSYAFYYCSSLTSINIPDGVTSIGDYAFYYCYNLTSITFGDNSALTSIGNYAFYLCDNLTSITFSDNSALTSIGDYAFCGCSSLTSINIPDGVTSIGDYAFSGCDNLTSITFGDNSALTSIGNSAFKSCTSLTSITIPNSVTNIGSSAFYWCSSLTSVTSLATTPPTIYSSTFSDQYETATLYAASTDYATADYWENFTNIVYDTSGNAITSVTASTSAIRAIGNTIVITTETAQTAQVYSLAGQLLVKQTVAAGETTIGMPTGGVYVVVLDDGTKAKILVK